MSADAAAVLEFDPYDYIVQDDPYPFYASLREHAPLYYNTSQDFWALSRHADIVAALRDEATYSNGMGVSLDDGAWGPNAKYVMSFLAMDPPDQTRLRSLVSRGFTPRRVRDLEPQIRGLAREYLDEVLARDDVDFIDHFAGKLPMDVVSELMGVPPSDRMELRRLSDLLVHRADGSRDVPAAGQQAALTLFSYYADMLADRRKSPKDDLTSALAVAEADGDRLNDQEIIGFLFLMIVAGNETTTKLLGNSLYWGARNPDQLATVLQDRSRVPLWVEETLRYDASTQLLARYLLQDVELHGQVAPAGARLVLLLGSGNRDSAVFAEPDRFDVDRDTTPMISFGGGRHYCLGANLARLEANIALDELVSRVGHIEVDEAGAQRVHSVNVRGFAHLPVTLGAR
jgi:cytochrome P450